jgi:putative membrane protein
MVSAVVVYAESALAQTKTPSSECFNEWKSADADRNGVIDKGEAGGQAQGTTRDQFLASCVKGERLFEPKGQPSQAGIKDDFYKDLGKGDLTQGKNPYTEADARKRLETLGFGEVVDLKLDDKGIWRGTAVSKGERTPVGLDAQGDVVAQ